MGSLAQPEDAASVLEQFVHDVANIPAEITHLLEEIQAKDLQIAAFKDEIHKRDAQLQKWVRVNGGHVPNPKEEAFSKTINDCYDKCEILQAEKCGLAEKACIVYERQLKRLDIGLDGLIQTEQFPADNPWISLAKPAGQNKSAAAVSAGGPLQAVSSNIGSVGGAPNFANAAQAQLNRNNASSRSAAASGNATPTTNPRGQREGSSDTSKRRRLNASLGSLPTASSHLRQSSLGPGTPKAGTPVPAASSRAGSAQPTRPGGGHKKAAQPSRNKGAPPVSKKAGARSRPSNKKSDRRRQLARDRATPSTNASHSDESGNESGSPTPSSVQRAQMDGIAGNSGGADDENDDPDDDALYCICNKVSFGDMVGCENDDCPRQWFHYKCVGVIEEPEGLWYCPDCKPKAFEGIDTPELRKYKASKQGR